MAACVPTGFLGSVLDTLTYEYNFILGFDKIIAIFLLINSLSNLCYLEIVLCYLETNKNLVVIPKSQI
jgi:hypothetical protein